MRLFTALLVAAMVAAACGDAGVDVGAGGGSPVTTAAALVTTVPGNDPPPLTEEFDADCRRVAGALVDRDASALIAALGPLIAAVPDTSSILSELDAGVLDDQTAEIVAPFLFRLVAGLEELGANDCSGIAELAAAFVSPQVDPAAVFNEMEVQQARWRAAGVDTYGMDLMAHLGLSDSDLPCGVDTELSVAVADGEVDLAVDKRSGCVVDEIEVRDVGGVLTVDDLFTFIQHNVDRHIDVVYDAEYGYPLSIAVEGPEGIIEISINDFTPGDSRAVAAADVLAALDDNRARWRDQNIDDYTYTVNWQCFCGPGFIGPFVVGVAGGDVIEVRGSEPLPDGFDGDALSIEGLFDLIERNAHADGIAVTYSDLGYPIRVDIDPERNAIDDELTVTVSDFDITG